MGKKKRETPEYTGRYSPVENGETTLFSTRKFGDSIGSPPSETIGMLAKACGMTDLAKGLGVTNTSCNVAEQLRIFKKYVPRLIKSYFAQGEVMAACSKNSERVTENNLERSGKKWDRDEDNLLIDLAAENDMSLMQIAIHMGRTPAAIQSRISYLVGIQKISREIAGRFVGTINGEYVNGLIDGELTREKVAS